MLHEEEGSPMDPFIFLRVFEDKLCVHNKRPTNSLKQKDSLWLQACTKYFRAFTDEQLQGTQSVYWEFTLRTVDVGSPSIAFIIVCCLFTGETFKSTRIWCGYKNQEKKMIFILSTDPVKLDTFIFFNKGFSRHLSSVKKHSTTLWISNFTFSIYSKKWRLIFTHIHKNSVHKYPHWLYLYRFPIANLRIQNLKLSEIFWVLITHPPKNSIPEFLWQITVEMLEH
jgi:hypothetical protein